MHMEITGKSDTRELGNKEQSESAAPVDKGISADLTPALPLGGQGDSGFYQKALKLQKDLVGEANKLVQEGALDEARILQEVSSALVWFGGALSHLETSESELVNIALAGLQGRERNIANMHERTTHSLGKELEEILEQLSSGSEVLRADDKQAAEALFESLHEKLSSGALQSS